MTKITIDGRELLGHPPEPVHVFGEEPPPRHDPPLVVTGEYSNAGTEAMLNEVRGMVLRRLKLAAEGER